MSDNQYYIERQCKDCGNCDRFYFPKMEIAFELYDLKAIHSAKCSKCNSKNCALTRINPFQLDKEILLKWSTGPKLYLMSQDEELLLANEIYLDLILDLNDNHEILPIKRKIIFEALCIIIYDINQGIEPDNQQLLERVKSEILNRKQQLLDSNDFIMDYVKEIVYPILEIKIYEA